MKVCHTSQLLLGLNEAFGFQISVCDISENMLSVGRHRAEALGYHGIDWVCGDAQNLPFEDDTFDCYTIAFGIRNVVDVQKVGGGDSICTPSFIHLASQNCTLVNYTRFRIL